MADEQRDAAFTADEDSYSQNDWVAFITACAAFGMGNPSEIDVQYPWPDVFRDAMLNVCGVALAALEALDRYESQRG